MLTRPHTAQIQHRDRHLDEVLDNRMALEDFGAIGNGIADDTVALQAALAAGRPLIAKPGATYKVLDLLDMASGTHLDLTGATIDASAMPVQNASSTRVVRSHGDYGAVVALASDASRGDFTVNVNNSGLVAGDMAMLHSQKLFDSANTDTKEGEIVFVRSATPTTVTLQGPIVGNYDTTNTAAIAKLTPRQNMSVKGGTILGPALPNTETNVRILDFRVTANVLVEGTVFKNVGQTCVHFTDSVWAKVAFCSFEGSEEAEHLAYGVAFGNASQDCIASNNSCFNRRHFFTTTNQSTAIGQVGITRRIKFQGNVMYRGAEFEPGSPGDAIDSHGGCEDIEILDNTVYYSTGNGINFEGKSAVIRGNTIYSSALYGIRVHNETDNTGSITVSNNKVLGAGSGGILIEEGFRGAGFGYATVECSNNNVLLIADVIGINIFVDVAEASRPRLTINNNNVQAGNTAMNVSFGRHGTIAGNALSGLNGLVLNGGPIGLAVSGNQIRCTSAAGNGLQTLGAVRCTFSGNTIVMPDAAAGVAINLQPFGGVQPEGNAISGNTGIPGAAATGGILQAAGASYSIISSNVMRGFTTPISAGAGVGHVTVDNVV